MGFQRERISKIKRFMTDSNILMRYSFLVLSLFFLIISCAKDYDSLKIDKSKKLISPHKYDLIIEKGFNFSENKMMDSAFSYFVKAKKLDPNRIESFYGLGCYYAHLAYKYKSFKIARKAVRNLNEVIDVKSNYRHAYYNRALSYNVMNDHYSAINDLDSAIHFNKKVAIYYLERAFAKKEISDFQGACNDIKYAQELGEFISKNMVDEFCNRK